MKKVIGITAIVGLLAACPAPQGKTIPPLTQWSCAQTTDITNQARCVDWTESVDGHGGGGIRWVTGPYYMAVVAQRYDPKFQWGHVLP